MSNISQAVKMALVKGELSQKDLADSWNTTRAAICSKLNRDAWSGNELVDVARLTGGRLAFVYPDGQQIFLTTDKPARLSVTKG